MLSDEHLSVLYYEPMADRIFPNTDIKGGICITSRDAKKSSGAIGTFTVYPELNTIVKKITPLVADNGLDKAIYSQGFYRFSDAFFTEHPEAKQQIGAGTGSKIVSSIIQKLPDVFVEEPTDKKEYVRILGRIGGKRGYKFILRKYLIESETIDKYKLFIPEANNSGKYGETLTEPTIGYPNDITADTYLCTKGFNTEEEPRNLMKYMQTKFFRALLGVKKVTQHCPPTVWKYVPLQNFTPASDIDWSRPIPEIDRQLYRKYGLSEQEIAFIESHVKEMA